MCFKQRTSAACKELLWCFFDASFSRVVLSYRHQNLLPAARVKADLNHLLPRIQPGLGSVDSGCLPLHLLAALRSWDGQALVMAVAKTHHVSADQVPWQWNALNAGMSVFKTHKIYLFHVCDWFRFLTYGHVAWWAGGLNVPQGLHERGIHLGAAVGDGEVLQHRRTSAIIGFHHNLATNSASIHSSLWQNAILHVTTFWLNIIINHHDPINISPLNDLKLFWYWSVEFLRFFWWQGYRFSIR